MTPDTRSTLVIMAPVLSCVTGCTATPSDREGGRRPTDAGMGRHIRRARDVLELTETHPWALTKRAS